MATEGWSRRALKLVAAGADRVHPPARGIVILIYHRVGARSAMEVDLPRHQFERQMDLLAADGSVVTLDEALGRIDGPVPDGPDPVVVTFDDGTADVVDVALPILVERQLPALLYLTTGYVDGEDVPVPDAAALSWAGLRDAVSTGYLEVGSHTHRHALLDRLDPATVADELDRSIDLIGAHLGTAPRHFAYPKAVAPHPEAERAVRDRFATAALAGTRANRYGVTDPLRLARSPVQRADDERWFRAKCRGGMSLEDRVRQGLARWRYAGRST
jgi:peptidoglycan/xylan/chitin deacetylase (PgdA/CDA1 family)